LFSFLFWRTPLLSGEASTIDDLPGQHSTDPPQARAAVATLPVSLPSQRKNRHTGTRRTSQSIAKSTDGKRPRWNSFFLVACVARCYDGRSNAYQNSQQRIGVGTGKLLSISQVRRKPRLSDPLDDFSAECSRMFEDSHPRRPRRSYHLL